MKVLDVPIRYVAAAPWNANEMDPDMRTRLRRSIERFGLVVPLVVRPLGADHYESIGGAQRLALLREMGHVIVPCVVTRADDGDARLLSQVLNHVAGQDNPGLRGEILRRILESTPESEVAELLPDPIERLRDLTQIGQEDLAEYLRRRLRTDQARLEHLVFQFTHDQLSIVRAALRRAGRAVPDKKDANPNRRGNALVAICRHYLQEEDSHGDIAR